MIAVPSPVQKQFVNMPPEPRPKTSESTAPKRPSHPSSLREDDEDVTRSGTGETNAAGQPSTSTRQSSTRREYGLFGIVILLSCASADVKTRNIRISRLQYSEKARSSFSWT